MQTGIKLLSLAALITATLCGSALAADYQAMSTEELAGARGSMRTAAPEDRAAFQQAWQERTQQMSAEEKRQYSGRPDSAPQDGSGSQYRKGNRKKVNTQTSMANTGYSGRGSGMGGGMGGGRGGGRR